MLLGDKCDIIFGVELKNFIYFEFLFYGENKVLLESYQLFLVMINTHEQNKKNT